MNLIKKLLNLTILITVTISTYGQRDINNATADITKEIKLPTRKEAGTKQLTGIYTFVVELDGSLSTVGVKDSVGFGIDEQIVKKLSEAKGWKVPEIVGKPARISYQLPIRFHLPK